MNYQEYENSLKEQMVEFECHCPKDAPCRKNKNKCKCLNKFLLNKN